MSLLSPQLKAFVAIVKWKTVQEAAKRIGLTQTGVTQRIRSLEAELETTLFIRSRRGMNLTHEGETLLRYCRGVLDLEGETLAVLKHYGKERELRFTITGPSSLMRTRIIPSCTRLLTFFPHIFFNFDIDDRTSIVHKLREGSADIAAVSPEDVAREMDSKLLTKDRYVLVGSPAWKKRPLKEIIRDETIVDFDIADQATFSYLRQFGLIDLAKKSRHFANNTGLLAEMVAGGVGYTVLSEAFAKPFIESGSLIVLNSGKYFDIPVALAWYPRPQLPDYFSAIIKAIK